MEKSILNVLLKPYIAGYELVKNILREPERKPFIKACGLLA